MGEAVGAVQQQAGLQALDPPFALAAAEMGDSLEVEDLRRDRLDLLRLESISEVARGLGAGDLVLQLLRDRPRPW